MIFVDPDDDDAAADHADNNDDDFNVLGSVSRWY
jgi:hypothetical protein